MPPTERRLWLVRHGETEGQSSIRYHGSNDVPLSDVGREQIRSLAPLLAGVAFERIVHSPLQRAAESAAILVAALQLGGVPVASDARLREIHFGACEGLTREEIDAAHPAFFADYEAGRVDAFPGGEPRSRFDQRVADAVQQLDREHRRGDLLVVGHRGTVRHAACTLLGVDATGSGAGPGSVAARFAVELASVTVLRQAVGPWQVEAVGLRP